MTEWRSRYQGYGVLVYWHVETNAVCIYSQLRNFSSSEVAAMIEGLIRHDTEMHVEKNFVDSHGQSEVASAFCRLLGGVRLMPRLKRIRYERLYLPEVGMGMNFPNLAGVLTRPSGGRSLSSSAMRWSNMPSEKVFQHTRELVNVRPPNTREKHLPDLLADEELVALYETVWHTRHPLHMVMKLLIFTGVRNAELVNVRL